MDTLQAFENRYTTKLYNSKKKLSAATIEELKSILQLSPSSINSQPWHFTFIQRRELRQKLAEYSWFNAHKITDSYAIVVFSAMHDTLLFEKWLTENQPQGAVDYYNTYVAAQGIDYTRSWYTHQLYLSVGVLLSACAMMDIDATPMEGFDGEKYDEILAIDGYRSQVVVAIGVRDDKDNNQPSITPKSRRPLQEIITSL